MKPYFQVRNELSVRDSLVLKGNKLVIPKQLQTRILDLAHESHRGLKKTKQLLRSKVWFPNIDAKVEDMQHMSVDFNTNTRTTSSNEQFTSWTMEKDWS